MEQKATLLELRAVTGMARLHLENGRPEDAASLLAPFQASLDPDVLLPDFIEAADVYTLVSVGTHGSVRAMAYTAGANG